MSGGTGEHSFNVSCRAAQSKKQFEAEQQAKPEASALADYYAEQHRAREEKRAREEAERYREAEEYVRQKKIEEKRRMLERLLAATYGATPEEITRVDNLVRAYTPGDYGKFDVHAAKLLELRSVLGN